MASSGNGVILLPYQRRWLNDRSPLKIWVAARQTGKSFALSLEAVTEALERTCVNLVLSASERQSREVVRKVHMHLRCLSAASAIPALAERETKEEVALPGGSRIISLPASPDTVRGFSGNVFLDEFAFHRDSREIWRAMYPAIARGYRVRITSTPNGKQNMFHEIWADGENGFSRHRTDIHQAAAEGLGVDIEELRRGIGEPDSWAQEFECTFLDEATAYITYEMISACEDDGATADFSFDERGTSSPLRKELYLGVDIGRKRDLTVLWLLERLGDVYWTRMVRVMERAPFREQREVLYSLLDGSFFGGCGGGTHVPLVRRCAIDSSGLGLQLAEEARERFGQRVEAVHFSGTVKEDLAVTARRRFEERQVRIPPDREIRRDIHSVKKCITPSGNARFDAERTEGSHADRFWALALALHAGGSSPHMKVAYETIARRSTGSWF